MLQAMITYKSWLYRTLETFVFFVPSLVFNIPVQKQLVSVELCDNYLSDPVSATVEWVDIQSILCCLYARSSFVAKVIACAAVLGYS